MNIYIPTYKRSRGLRGRDYFENAIYILPESQKDDYLKVLPIERMLVISNDEDGSIVKKRNWMLANLDRPYISIDDDVSHVTYMDDRLNKPGFVKYSTLDKSLVNEVFEHYTNLCMEFGAKMWGVSQKNSGDEREYKEFLPFSLTNEVLGPFHCHLDHDLIYDERMLYKEDYDMAIQHLHKYKKILRVNKLAVSGCQAVNPGGIVSQRSMKNEIDGAKAIMNKWGNRVVKYNLKPKCMNDIISGNVSVPIKGV